MTDLISELGVRGLVGSEGTVFLTGGATLAHLKDGESVRLCAVDVTIAPTPEFIAALLELQDQHTGLYRTLIHHGALDQCVVECDPGECLSCDIRALEERWSAERAGSREAVDVVA